MLLNCYHKILHIKYTYSYICMYVKCIHIVHIGLGTVSDRTLHGSVTASTRGTVGRFCQESQWVGDRGRKGSIRT